MRGSSLFVLGILTLGLYSVGAQGVSPSDFVQNQPFQSRLPQVETSNTVDLPERFQLAQRSRRNQPPPPATAIEGDFDFKLGDKFKPKGEEPNVDLPGGVVMYMLKPTQAVPPFKLYNVYLTPKSRIIFKITAMADVDKRSAPKVLVKRWIEKISDDTGLIPAFTGEEDSIATFKKAPLEIYIKRTQDSRNDPHRIELQFLDKKLERRAALERPRR